MLRCDLSPLKKSDNFSFRCSCGGVATKFCWGNSGDFEILPVWMRLLTIFIVRNHGEMTVKQARNRQGVSIASMVKILIVMVWYFTIRWVVIVVVIVIIINGQQVAGRLWPPPRPPRRSSSTRTLWGWHPTWWLSTRPSTQRPVRNGRCQKMPFFVPGQLPQQQLPLLMTADDHF